MKGALACYLEATRAVLDAGIKLKGDLTIACVVGEIEKTQWGEEFQGREYRGYAAGGELPTHVTAEIADMCILGEPTEQRSGAQTTRHDVGPESRLTGTVRPHRVFGAGRLQENSIVRMREVIDDSARVDSSLGAPGGDTAAKTGVVNLGVAGGAEIPGASAGRRTETDLFLDIRVPPTMRMQDAKRALGKGRALVRGCAPSTEYGVGDTRCS